MNPDPPGVQIERTRLAWRRTTLAATGAALVAIGVLVRHPTFPTLVAAIGVLILWGVMLVLAQRRIIDLDRCSRSTAALATATRHPAVLGLLTAGLAAAGLCLVALAL